MTSRSSIIRAPIIATVLGNWPDEKEVFSTALMLPSYRCDGTELTNTESKITFALEVRKADARLGGAFKPFVGTPRISATDYDAISTHTFSATVSGPLDKGAGSLGTGKESALELMNVITAFLNSCGSGVYIWNSGNAHSARSWQAIYAETDRLAAAYGAFVTATRDAVRQQFFTTGMQCLRLPDVVLRDQSQPADAQHALFCFNMYQLEGQAPQSAEHFKIEVNHKMYEARKGECETQPPGSDGWNPHGQWILQPL
jgi:hypothetical protein